MQYMDSVFSLIFFIGFFIYLFLGAYIIKLNPKASINKLFLFMCMALSVWSFGFGMANSALNFKSALLWRRVSAIGWTSMHSLTLHFIILLTNKKFADNKKKKLIIIYIPAIISMYVFSFSPSMSIIQYNLVKTNFGWTNIASNNFHDWFFNFYYAIYTIIGLILLWKWKNRLKDKKTSKQVKLIFIAIFLSLILGSLTDIVPSGTFMDPLPQMSPIFIMFPVWAMYYSAIHYDLIKKENINRDDLILTQEDEKRLFSNIEYAFYIGGILIFISKYFIIDDKMDTKFLSVIIRCSLLFIMGFGVRGIQIIKKESTRQTFTMIILLLSIPIISLQFLNLGNISIWMLPILIILASLVFNKKILLISATIIAILTQRLNWILKPEISIKTSSFNYIIRIFMFIIAYFVASRVNDVFISKVKKNIYQIKFQRMNSQLSFNFININKEDLDDKINIFLCKIGHFFKIDRAYLILINHENNTMTCTHEWCNTGIKEAIYTIDEVLLEIFPWWIEQLESDNFIYIEDVYKMPKQAISERQHLIKQNIKSLLVVPVEGDGKIQGFIGLDSINSFKIWSKEHIELLGVLSNIIARGLIQVQSDKQLEYMAYYDHLTKLPNRFLFSIRVNQAIELAKRNETFIAVVFIDLDDFKSVNDSIGHSGGDLLLKNIARDLTKILRTSDTVARFGGDEFMVLLDNIKDLKDIKIITKKIMIIFNKSFNIHNQRFSITGSAGVAVYPIDGEDSETLIKNADTAMYKAKAKGKNQYTLCTQFMKDEVMTDMLLSNELYRALERNEFQVYYQPQIDLLTGKISGLEALLRWIHPERGIISPNIFIPLAEKNGLISSIGEWVLRTACIQNKTWQDMGLEPIKIGVNLSATQFINPNLAKNVEIIIHDTRLNPKYLELEITENIAIKETHDVLSVLNKLKEIGVSIAIDDFGTEYSSFNRLKNLPIDRIKIDMQFIQGIQNDEKDRAITMIIINLGKSLGLNVLAEGVETKGQLDFLNQKKCDFVQGYYFYRPMPADEIEKILKDSMKYGLIVEN